VLHVYACCIVFHSRNPKDSRRAFSNDSPAFAGNGERLFHRFRGVFARSNPSARPPKDRRAVNIDAPADLPNRLALTPKREEARAFRVLDYLKVFDFCRF
jgi:hypothetical protein